MTYIRCPECGQKALSVATQCPKCGFVLTQNPMQSGGTRGLVECRECQKMIPRGVAECPYCGYTGRSLLWPVLAVVVTVVVVGGAGYGVWWLVSGSEQADAVRPQLPPAFVSASRDTGTTRGPATRDSVAAADTGRAAMDTSAAAPRAGQPLDTARAATPPVTPAPRPPAPTSLLVRWTDNWVNLREGPGLGYDVVRIILPGTRIEVGRSQSGWWPVWEQGDVVGYVAGSELARTPPDSTAAR